ncbi:MAG: guanylate kinase [Vicinamibacterales bacterium]|jgi:guanylate kinase|nr:guanylate kinase [Vicinamibacterales bacterium]
MSSETPARGSLFIVSAPSGTGKTTVVEDVIRQTGGLVRSRSFTSRAAREGELDGEAYYFVSRTRFESMIAGDQFLEWAEVFGNLYGTGVVETERLLSAGQDVVLVIDVQGARQVRRRGVPVVTVFLLPPSAQVLEARLRGRSQDADEAIARRLTVAREEMRAYPEYDFVVVNDELDEAVEELRAIVVAQRARLASRAARAADIAATFEPPAGS